ncbi:MAG: hypothetical protein ACOYD4_04800 [Solirubrobacterales bacterium]
MKRLRLRGNGQSKFTGIWPILLAAIVLALAAIPALAFASDAPEGEDSDAASAALPDSALREAQAAQLPIGPQLTDAQAATELPHRDLNRAEAFDLLEGVFEPVLQSPAGPFDSLDVKKFLSDTAAIVYPSTSDSPEGVTVGDEEAGQSADTPALAESSVPMRVENPDGSSEAVDLTLEHSGGEIRSVAPLEPVLIPEQLGEGIELPRAGIQIELVGAAQERTPSIIEESVAAYPNVATDSDLAVAPTPTGVETFTTLRSSDAPRTQTYHLDLPSGANLIEADLGAEVVQAGQTILRVMPASAIDATGSKVPVSMTVAGDDLTLTVSPQPGTAYPVIVDPTFLPEGFNWKIGSTVGWAGWDPWTNNGTIIPGFGENWGPGWMGAYLEAQANYYPFGAQAGWTHTVPRLAAEEAKGRYPTSFFRHLTLAGVYFETSAGLASPFLFGGIFDPQTQKWAGVPGNEQVWSYPGNAAWAWGATLNFENGTEGKRDTKAQKAFGMSLAVSEPGWLTAPRASYLGAAFDEIADEDNPGVGTVTPPSAWANQTPTGSISADVEDTGLGIKYVSFIIPGQGEVTLMNACGGQTQDPCPREQTVSLAASKYSVASLPTGTTTLSVRALDVLGRATPEASLGKAQLKVDHAKPELGLSGTLTEQGTLGTTLPSYTLKYEARDGASGAPQSGVASTEVKIDGKAVEAKYSPRCSTQNCAITKELTLTSSAYSTGSHTVEVIATDAVGLQTTKTLSITIGNDSTGPTVAGTGPFFSGPEGWVQQKNYFATVKATDVGGYGVTSLVLKMDGTAVQTKSQSCEKGSCEASFSKFMNMALYDGGSHTAEVIAKDGAGNTTTKPWTINVDPSGAISPTEAADTLEAMEATEPEATIVTPTDEAIGPDERAAGNDPGLAAEGGQIVSVGVPVETSLSKSSHTVVVQGAEAEFEITPVSAPSTEPKIIEEVAAVSPSSASGSDTIIRPKYNGLTAFQAIREVSAPETYSWEVGLLPGQTLKSLEGGEYAVVYFEDGSEAMLISASPAVDAVGHAVPTHLAITGSNIVTLTVEHKEGSYVYPVVAGPAYEVAYSVVEAVIPPPPSPPSAEPELVTGVVGPPVRLPAANTDDGGATASAALPHYAMPYEWDLCPPGIFGGCWAEDIKIEGRWEYNRKFAWWKESKPHPKCPNTGHVVSMELTYCNWVGPNHQKYGGGYHISSLDRVNITGFVGATFTVPEHLTMYMYGDGYGYGHNTEAICNPLSVC